MTKKIQLHKVGMSPSQASDAMSGMEGASSALWQLEALFKAIAKGSENKINDVKELANLGAYVSCDIANFTDCLIEYLESGEVEK